MNKFLILTAAVAAAVGNASAGSIQTQIDLTKANLSGSNAATGLNGSTTTNWVERNYSSIMFDSATYTAPMSMVAVPVSPYMGYVAVPPTGGTTSGTLSTNYSGSSIQFNMLNDACGLVNACNGARGSDNYWTAPVNSNPTMGMTSALTIPIGIFDVTDLWTVLQNEYGLSGVNDTSVQFNWGSTATTADGPSVTVNLSNASNSGMSGQIRSAVLCGDSNVVTSCALDAIGQISPYSVATGTGTGVGQIGIFTSNLLNAPYNNMLGGSSNYTGSSSGTVALDDQGFFFNGLNEDKFLVNIKIMENVGQQNVSSTALTAVTVDSTPEPASIWLGVTGLVMAVGASRVRRRRRGAE